MRLGWEVRREIAVDEVVANIAGSAAEKTDAEELMRCNTSMATNRQERHVDLLDAYILLLIQRRILRLRKDHSPSIR
jgi:hypothetical protein